VDQQKTVGPAVVETVARDFDLSDGSAAAAMTTPPPPASNNHGQLDLVDALRSIANLADRLRDDEKDLPKERKL